MNITSIAFTNAKHTAANVTLDDGSTFGTAWPCLTWHGEYVEAWLESGGQVQPFTAPPMPLADLAPYQFRAMLKLSGKQDDLYAFIEALPEPQRTVAQSKLEYSLVFKRDNDLVAAAKGALGLTDAELDGLWLEASQIT